MNMITAGLLGFGMFFPALSLLTLIASAWTKWRTGRNASAVIIPVIGPALLTSCVLIEGWTYWLIPAAWICDVGTIMYFIVLPRLISEWWRTSWFTICLSLRGGQGIESAVLTLHSGGHYLLTKNWHRPAGTLGILGLGEPGTYEKIDNRYELISHFGLRRTLVPIDDTTPISFAVVEATFTEANWKDYSLADWTLQS